MRKICPKINHAKTHLPRLIASGTTEQRLQKARLLNLDFFEQMMRANDGADVTPRTFSSFIKKASSSSINVSVRHLYEGENPNVKYSLNTNLVCKGYNLAIPFKNFEKKIAMSSAPVFLNETQRIFNAIFNPKFIARVMKMASKYKDVDSSMDFFTKNISNVNELKPKALDDFLKEKTLDMQIDALQFMRYELLDEQNVFRAKRQIDRRIEKYNNLKFQRPEGYYDFAEHKYEEKLQILNQKLKALLDEARGRK